MTRKEIVTAFEKEYFDKMGAYMTCRMLCLCDEVFDLLERCGIPLPLSIYYDGNYDFSFPHVDSILMTLRWKDVFIEVDVYDLDTSIWLNGEVLADYDTFALAMPLLALIVKS